MPGPCYQPPSGGTASNDERRTSDDAERTGGPFAWRPLTFAVRRSPPPWFTRRPLAGRDTRPGWLPRGTIPSKIDADSGCQEAVR